MPKFEFSGGSDSIQSIRLARLGQIKRVLDGIKDGRGQNGLFDRRYWHNCLIGEVITSGCFEHLGFFARNKKDSVPEYEGYGAYEAIASLLNIPVSLCVYAFSAEGFKLKDKIRLNSGAMGVAIAKARLQTVINFVETFTYEPCNLQLNLAFTCVLDLNTTQHSFEDEGRVLSCDVYNDQAILRESVRMRDQKKLFQETVAAIA